MNKTKKGFLITGGILLIVGAVLVVAMFLVPKFVGAELLRDYIAAMSEGEELTTEEIDELYYFLVDVYNTILISVIISEVINLVLGIVILVKTSHGTIANGLIITALVFSILSGATLSMVCMIVALCIKDKPIDNVNSNIETIQV